jgi:hypothetical protein
MAIGTPTSIATPTQDGSTSATHTITTNATAPSGSLVIAVISWGSSTARTVAMSGTLTWATDQSQAFNGAVQWGYAICSAQAPSGLASSTVLTATFSGTILGANIAVFYCTGLATSSPTDVSTGQGVNTASASWTTGTNTTTVADTLVIGGCIIDANTSSTATVGTELADWLNTAHDWTTTTTYRILSATALTSLTGTWGVSGAADKTSAFVAYKIDAGGGGGAATPKQLAALGVGT